MLMTTPDPADAVRNDPRWHAIVTRDRAHDGRFVYAVRTTGIYCRPVCPSRRPDPANVAFYAAAREAFAAGYRACRRCDPDGPGGDAKAALVAAACRRIEGAEGRVPLAELAREAGLSAPHFQRVFKSALGISPAAYAAGLRAGRLSDALRGAAGNVADAIYGAGYGAASRGYKGAEARLGMTPGQVRRGGPGETIRFAIGQSSLGAVLVATTARGVCAILMGDDPDALVRDLQDRFPYAEFLAGDDAFNETMAAVIALVERPGTPFDLPLDIRGTTFQARVWRALMEIAPGETVGYAALAARLGLPAATRAVAGACAANALAVVVPCHRVVRTDGGLSGYRWGVERKRVLLEREREAADAARTG